MDECSITVWMADLLIFRSKLMSLLHETESEVCGSGHCDSKDIQPPGRCDFAFSVHNSLRAHHEAVIGSLKAFKVFSERFRQDPSLHSTCSFVVANQV